VYWADGAGSSAVFFSLLEVLDDLRAELGSDRAIALYQPTGTTRGHFVLSDSVGGDLAPALANERLLINQRIDGDAPSVLAGVVASSTLRDFSIGLASALAVPWVDGFGRGVALIGIDDTSAAARTPVTEASRRLVTTLDQSRLSGTLALQHQLSEAVRSVLSEGVAGSGAGRVGRLGSLVTTAREIFGSDTAYLALPEEGDTANYYFAAMSNVETPQFRQLRMSFGQGLGGLARREGRVVRSLKYRDDVRLFDAPVRETAEEGIHSAMAAPLVHDGSVRGVLYVGNRHATPFSDTDERMLEEFADLVALLMGEPDYRPAVRAAQTARLREDFAHSIHDSVVRSLVHIGFTAEQASAGMRADDAARTISVIRSAAEDALANLRAELGGLTMDAGAGTTHIGEIVDQITDVPVRPGAERTVRVSADTADRTPTRSPRSARRR
jgi:signal transduction histidine kinase